MIFKPERFKLSLAAGVFDSFLNSWPQPRALENATVIFLHDKITYRGEIRHNRLFSRGVACWSTTITLPNDGFFYPHPQNLKVFSSESRERHGTEGWLLLDHAESKVFDAMKLFAATKLGTKPQYHIFYNFDHNMMDFQAINKETRDLISFSFHYGVPETDFDDQWFEDE